MLYKGLGAFQRDPWRSGQTIMPGPQRMGENEVTRLRHQLLFDLVLALHVADDLEMLVVAVHLSTAIDQLATSLPHQHLGWLEEARAMPYVTRSIRQEHLRQHLVYCLESCDSIQMELVGAYIALAIERFA